MGQDFLREIRSMLLRMSLLEHGLAVEGSGQRAGRGSMGGMQQDPMAEDPEDIMSSLSHLEDNQQDAAMMESSLTH